jgi:hypothetical protein
MRIVLSKSKVPQGRRDLFPSPLFFSRRMCEEGMEIFVSGVGNSAKVTAKTNNANSRQDVLPGIERSCCFACDVLWAMLAPLNFVK